MTEEYAQFQVRRTAQKIALRQHTNDLMIQIKRLYVAQGWHIGNYRQHIIRALSNPATPEPEREAARQISDLRFEIARANDKYSAWVKSQLYQLAFAGDEDAQTELEDRGLSSDIPTHPQDAPTDAPAPF